MQRFAIALLLLLAVSSMWAQTQIPGTFSAQPPQPTAIVAGPILTPPEVSYGAGLFGSPAVVNGLAYVVTAPQPTYVEPSAIANTTRTLQNSGSNGTLGAGSLNTQTAAAGPGYFDYIVAPRSGGLAGVESVAGNVGDPSLGQVAASLRKGPPPTQHLFTNDDIARLKGVTNNNYQMPGASTDQPAYPQQQPHSEASAPLPPGAKPSPFSPRPMNQSAANAPAEQAAEPEATQMAQNTTPQPPNAQSESQATQPNASSADHQADATSPSSAQASTQRRLPASSSPLPLLAMLGATALGAGYTLAKRR